MVLVFHRSSYEDTVCGGDVSHFSAIKNNLCIPASTTFTYRVNFPVMSFFYNSADCSAVPLFSETVSTDCAIAQDLSDGNGDDDGFGTTTLSHRVTLYTGFSDAPSPRPTSGPPVHMPTPAPSANDLVYFSASQVGSLWKICVFI